MFNSNDMVISPSILTFITTFKCTAACKDCCFECNPKREGRLSLKQMKEYLDQSIKAYPSIKVLILTGGECFLLKSDLDKIVLYASNKGLRVRIVTNGYWASSFEKAIERLSILVNSGLNEINFSTGDDHLEFVSENFVVNGLRAALKLGLTTVVNVEANRTKEFNSFAFLKNEELAPYLKPNENGEVKLMIVNGVWLPFTKSSKLEFQKMSPLR